MIAASPSLFRAWRFWASSAHPRDAESDNFLACAATSLCFVLAARARKLSLSASLEWAEEIHKRRARKSDGEADIVEVLSYTLFFGSLRLVVVALGRSTWWLKWACDRHDMF